MLVRDMMTEEDRKAVMRLPIFEGLSNETVISLTMEASTVIYDVSTLLLSHGEPITNFFVVLRGRVRLFVLTANGRQSIIDVIEPVRSFGEAALFGSGVVPVNVEAEQGTRLIKIPGGPILRRLVEDAELARKMMDSLARRQRPLINQIGNLKIRSPIQRLSMTLLGWSSNTAGSAIIRIPISKTELASHIGITPESLSRAWDRLRHLGVTCQGTSVTISDIAVLRNFSGMQDEQVS